MQPNHIGPLSCYPTDKPGGPVFLIVASLITVLLSFPLHFMLTYILSHYAGRWPGSRGFEDEIVHGNEITEKEVKVKNGRSIDVVGDDHTISTAEMLRNSKRDSAFGTTLKKGILLGTAVDVNTVADISQIAYAGK